MLSLDEFRQDLIVQQQNFHLLNIEINVIINRPKYYDSGHFM